MDIRTVALRGEVSATSLFEVYGLFWWFLQVCWATGKYVRNLATSYSYKVLRARTCGSVSTVWLRLRIERFTEEVEI